MVRAHGEMCDSTQIKWNRLEGTPRSGIVCIQKTMERKNDALYNAQWFGECGIDPIVNTGLKSRMV
jgi:hypothetical protein